MSDEHLLIAGPPKPEPTQLALHPKEQRRGQLALWASCAAVLISLTAAVGSVWQAREAGRARIEAERSRQIAEKTLELSRSLSEAADRTASANEDSVKVAARGINVALDSLMAQTRPYIEITGANFSGGGLAFKFRNSGTTTAYNLHFQYWVELESTTYRAPPVCVSDWIIDGPSANLPSSAVTEHAFYPDAGPSSDPHDDRTCWPKLGDPTHTIDGRTLDPNNTEYDFKLTIRYTDRNNRSLEQRMCYMYDPEIHHDSGETLEPCF
jgi:hypothetical protein